uniref:Uncharacterized protein n=1 Tax=Angiostrongylus cantonensis TaxID=6313 RepID=A0A0K0DNG6_ANGCA
MDLLYFLLLLFNIGTHFILPEEIIGWRDDYVDWCKTPKSQDYEGADFFCLSYFWNYIDVRVELHCFEPVIIIYRDFLSRSEIDGFVADIEIKQENGIRYELPTDGVKDAAFRPKEITMRHREGNGTAAVFEKIQTIIPAINFTVSEPWQILSYEAGEHYPPRYDFLKSTTDTFTQRFGNRFATFMIVLRKAKALGLGLIGNSKFV